MNYEKDMYIDTEALDVEWTEQAPLAMRYGIEWSDKKDELERAHENVKLVRAELNQQINEDPEKFLGEAKPTVANVDAAIMKHKIYTAAREAELQAMKAFSLIDIAKNEISFTRKAALEALVTLHGQQYFAGPKVPRNLAEEIQKHKVNRQSATEHVNKSVRMRRRG